MDVLETPCQPNLHAPETVLLIHLVHLIRLALLVLLVLPAETSLAATALVVQISE